MTSILPGVAIRIGDSAATASSSYRALDVATPFISWDNPPGYSQRRFNIKVSNAEPGGWANMTSGVIASTGRTYQFSSAIMMNANFEGLCKIEIALSDQASGDMAHISEPFYFVYDRVLERFYHMESLSFSWNTGSDPDSLPTNSQRLFHLQVSTIPTFDTILHQNSGIANQFSPIVQYDIPPTTFLPEIDQAYFYRVRQFDGLDWSHWSRVNAFWSLGNVPPTITIVHVTPLNNDDGDIIVGFTVADPDDEYVQVNFTYQENSSIERFVCSLATPAISVPNGLNQVTWKSNRDIPNRISNGVTLFARGMDEDGMGVEVFHGPINIDNSNAPLPGGGIGATNYNYPVEMPWLTPPPIPVDSTSGMKPVAIPYLAVIQNITRTIKDPYPMVGGWTAWWQPLQLGRLERSSHPGGITSGWSEADRMIPGSKLGWPTIISAAWMGVGDMLPQGMDTVAFSPGKGPLNPHVTESRFMFVDPDDFSQHSDAWPRPVSSRDLGANDDAWIQVVSLKHSNYPACPTCKGRNWLPSATSPFTRNPCDNPSCEDGFDRSQPPFMRNGRSAMKAYGCPTWMRLSEWMGGQYNVENRYGITVAPPGTISSTQHIVGRHLSDLDPATSKPKLWPIQIDPSVQSVTRQPGDGGNVDGWSRPLNGSKLDMVPQVTPSQLAIHQSSEYAPGAPDVVSGEHGPIKQTFFWGRDPSENPLMYHRPTPSQAWDIRVGGSIGRSHLAVPMRFRFMQPYWATYNTIHWDATGSGTSLYQVQVARQISGSQTTNWTNAIGDNAFYNSVAQAYLVPPLTFWMYWETRNRTMFPEGGTFRLRLRQYDSLSRTFSEWVYSNVFQIFDGVANPASVLSTTYEPWSKSIEVKLRIDDGQGRRYDLTKFWFSGDDGETWDEINLGDIAGQIKGLSSNPINGENIHTVTWDTVGRQLPPSDSYRIRVESMPSTFNEGMMLPFLRFYSLPNPIADPATSEIQSILGRRDNLTWDDESESWTPLDEPQYTPGQLAILEGEREQVRRRPGQSVPAPSGYYSFLDDDEQIVSPSGYQSWLTDPYHNAESNGQALSRIARAIDDMVNVDLPAAQNALFNAELSCRKRLMDQGYFAEAHFPEDDGVFSEVITVNPLGGRYGDVDPVYGVVGEDEDEDELQATDQVTRYWRYRVQAFPDGPSAIYDEDGGLDPDDFTALETVYFKLQLDSRPTFDSQSHGQPLREFWVGHDGRRLTVARHEAGSASMHASANPFIDPLQSDGSKPWEGVASDRSSSQFSDVTSGFEGRPVTMGGTLKMLPHQLPGQQPDDVIDGDTWEKDYHWRVAAYNVVTGPVSALPRHKITAIEMLPAQDTALVSFTSQSHQQVNAISLPVTTNIYGQQFISGYEISKEEKNPSWEGETQINVVSDRRTPFETAEVIVNGLSWVPTGTVRTRPCIIYSDRLMQYVGAWSKPGFSNKPRIVTSRGMALPTLAEYECLWERPGSHRPEAAIYGPWILEEPELNRFSLYCTVQIGPTPVIARSISKLADDWGNPTTVSGIASGANPCVTKFDGQYHMWFEKLDPQDDRVKIYYAKSNDGMSFTVQNSGNAVFAGAGDVGSPAVIRRGEAWTMFFSDHLAETISSVTSSNGTSWTGYQVERVSGIKGVPVHPFPFFDRFKGNDELFLTYNYLLGDTSTVHMARLEDRTWIEGQVNKIFGAPYHLTHVPSTRDGVSRQCAINLSSHGIVANDNIRVRMRFEITSPSSVEYHRQSEWVDTSNAFAMGGYLDPAPWHYSESLLAIPYMQIGNTS